MCIRFKASDSSMITTEDLQTMRMEKFTNCSKVLSQHLPGENEVNQDNRPPGRELKPWRP
jgi:hypothetical protein